MKQRGTRILWFSNAPWCATGYGVQAKRILPALADMPEVESVLIHSFYGLQGGAIQHRMGGHTFTVVPTIPGDEYSNTGISQFALQYEIDLAITLTDIWPLAENFGSGFNWCPYMPLDLDPIPDSFLKRMRNAYLPIVYAKQAGEVLDAHGIEHAYVPHGVDCAQYRPMVRSQKAFRRMLDWPEEAVNGYVYLMISANKGFPPRKAFPEVFEAFANVRRQHDDVWLYLHTLMGAEHGGPNLVDMAKSYGIADRVLAPNQHLYLSGAYDDQDMARVFNAGDVLLAPSYSEGFGLPIVEAESCGLPVIVTDAFAMTELCGAGWKIPWDHRLYMPIGGCYVMPSVDALTRAMLQAHEAGRSPFVTPARTFALAYDWDTIIADYWRPLIQRLHRELTPRVYRYVERPALVEV